MTRRSTIVLVGCLLATCLATGCGPSTFEDLGRPALVVVVGEPGGFCTSVYAIDDDNAVWSSIGCNDDSGTLERRPMTVSEAQRTMLEASMDEVLALPDDAGCAVVSPSGTRYRFVRTEPGAAASPEKRQCDPGVPLVALELAQAMRELASPPIPDAGTD